MNIFVLDNDPFRAAQNQCDKHVVKMILESAQLLCSAHHMCGTENLPERFYKLTHKNHPCSIWTRSHPDNYRWLARHAQGLLSEYTFRYGKTHASTDVIEWCANNQPTISSPKVCGFAQAMPDEYKQENPVNAYRAYYMYDKYKNIQMRWTKRPQPEWWQK